MRRLQTYNVLVCTLYSLEARPVLFKLCAEVFEPLLCLVCLCLDRFLLRKLAIIVNGARERGKGGVELGLQVWRRRCSVSKLVQIFSYRRRLPQSGIEERILFAT